MSQNSRWPYPVVRKGSKLGVHAIYLNRVKSFAEQLAADGAAFSVVKAVDDLAWLKEIRQISPQTITMARLTSPYEGCPGIDQPDTDLDQLASRLVEVILDRLEQDPELREVVDYWEVVNEPDPAGVRGYRLLADLMIRCMERAEEHGLKVAIFSFNSGTPEWREMVAVAETGVFARARRGGHILAVHEGVFWPSQPIDLWWGEGIPGAPEVEGAGALHFRYRYLYHLLHQRREVVPLVISEWYGGRYAQHGATPLDVVEQVRWCDEKYRQDYYVLGFCPFTLGPTEEWVGQDYEFAYPALVDYILSLKDEPNAPPPEPAEKPGRGLPREQYVRIYVLLPPDADSAWARAVIDATWDDRRFTVGGSADDAGIGDLDSRTVIAVNPSHWPGDLEEFYRTYYPGVRYIPVEVETPGQLFTWLRNLNL
ncbi:MAG TPA: hypothetical protein ENK08_11495 [Chloroflexi bacterium]|nr:hypothetical protein [Chloroflexota bacterium]